MLKFKKTTTTDMTDTVIFSSRNAKIYKVSVKYLFRISIVIGIKKNHSYNSIYI